MEHPAGGLDVVTAAVGLGLHVSVPHTRSSRQVEHGFGFAQQRVGVVVGLGQVGSQRNRRRRRNTRSAVDAGDPVAAPRQSAHEVPADEARGPGDDDGHGTPGLGSGSARNRLAAVKLC